LIKNITIEDIDTLLPQTQCGLCEYPGCRPYARAIVENNESIDRCLPGGVQTLISLGNLLNQEVKDLIPAMEKKQKPAAVAVIREEECIGCTKCIQACPVDAIIGASKHMHTIVSDVCTGCELCIPPCPVDCIDIITMPDRNEVEQKIMAEKSHERYEKRNGRLAREKKEKREKHLEAKLNQTKVDPIKVRQAFIQEAILRSKQRKSHEQK
jgi:electron transport complex protein RnfB